MRPPVKAPHQREPVAGDLAMSRSWYRFIVEQLIGFLGLSTGALIVPSMTTAERDALTAQNGMIIYNTTTTEIQVRENGAWRQA